MASLSPVPRGGPRSPWRWWGARGVGRRWPLPVVCGCCRSVGCRGRAARRVREPPCASCRMHHKDHHSPPATPPHHPPHATGDGDVSSVRETGTLNSLRAGRQTSVACMGRGIRVPLGCFSLVLGDAVTASGCLCVLSPLVRASPAQPWQPVHPQPALSKGREAPNFPLLLPQPMDDTASPPAPSPGRGTASKPTPCHCHGAKPNA